MRSNNKFNNMLLFGNNIWNHLQNEFFQYGITVHRQNFLVPSPYFTVDKILTFYRTLKILSTLKYGDGLLFLNYHLHYRDLQSYYLTSGLWFL
jgi:hypothetical protein